MSTRQASRPPQRRKTPVWVVVIGVVLGAVVLFAAGFGVSRLIRGGSSTASTESPSATAEPDQSCATVTVTPAEVLPQPAQITLNVYNSTNRVGLAAKTADELRARGFVVEKVDNDPKGSGMTSVGEVRFGSKGQEQAQVVAFYIPGVTLVNDGRKGKAVDVAIGQQYTALASKSDVDTAMSEPSESASGPGCPSPTKSKPGKSQPSEAPSGEASTEPSPTGEANSPAP